MKRFLALIYVLIGAVLVYFGASIRDSFEGFGKTTGGFVVMFLLFLAGFVLVFLGIRAVLEKLKVRRK